MNIRHHQHLTLVICSVLLAASPAALGHGGDPYITALFQEAYENVALTTPVETVDAVDILVTLAAEVHNEAGGHLLPPGTAVDRAEWIDSKVEIDLTLPADLGDWVLSPFDLETIVGAFRKPFDSVEGYAGLTIRARVGADGAYQMLADLIPQDEQAISSEPNADADVKLRPNIASTADGGVASISGQLTSATRQPIGALTGVTVFAAGGHGWTAGDSSWFLQRPLLLGMCEDYGNIDQLNLFCQYAFNAGATVVPMRPVGWQSIEIVIDQDDPEVSYVGDWLNSGGSPYYENGVTNSDVSYRYAFAAGTEDATARYTPNITVTDYYPVYCWALASNNRVRQTYRVAHSGGISEVVVDHSKVGTGWVWLGDYYLEAGGINYVEITNESTDTGVVIADAIRWGCGIGDVVRSGPGTISGYPRDEEAARYWAESEWGNNAVGFSSSLYDLSGYSDQSDNVGTGARISREMNLVPAGGIQSERWNRIYLEWHSNAANQSARGQITLITDTGSTTNQEDFATILSNEVDADMSQLDNLFEHGWIDRSSPTYTSSYGAISTGNNSDEFDATIIEIAFHDAQLDAELLRDATVRAAAARSSVQGIIRFLNQLPGSTIPLAFPPDTPRNVRIEDLGAGEARISWTAPFADGARGDTATGYVVYQSSNGKGFGEPIVLGNVLSTTVTGLNVGETKYYRIAATNNGGESMPSEVLAIRRPDTGTATVAIINGFDRIDRFIGGFDVISGVDTQRVKPRQINNGDYVIQHAEALAANNIGFVTTSNEAARDGFFLLDSYNILVWILGNEANELGISDDRTFDGSEQSRLSQYLSDGGSVFVTGNEIAHDLITLNSGQSFAVDTLHIGLDSDDANTYTATGAGGILSDIADFSFDPSTAPYPVYDADELLPGADAVACLNYVGGNGGLAGIQYTGPVYNAVVFGFAFETIASPSVRADIMQRVISFLETANGPLPFDQDRDGDVDFLDFQYFQFCYSSADNPHPVGHFCLDLDGDEDADVDVADAWLLQQVFTGSN